MSPEFQQHWLSAYLDDELSSDERALVERRLNEDPEARQLLDDLKRVRGLVATLPGWGEKSFKFDMSLLSDGQPADDEELDAPDSGDEPSIGTSEIMRASELPSAVETERRNKLSRASDHRAPRLSASTWRGLLALSAAVLLLVICGPYFWQSMVNPVAFRSVEQPGVGVGGVGGGVPSDGVDVHFVQPTPEMTGERNVADELIAPEPSINMPQPPASAPQLVPSDSPTMAKQDPRDLSRGPVTLPATPAPASPLASSAPQAARGRGEMRASRAAEPSRGVAEPNKGVESTTAALADAKAGTETKLDFAFSNFMCARSDAWSEAEVAQALPQLRSLSESERMLGERLTERDGQQLAESDTVKRLGKSPSSEPSKNEWLLADLPQMANVDNWFAQIQSTQQLSPVPLTQLERSKERAAGMSVPQIGQPGAAPTGDADNLPVPAPAPAEAAPNAVAPDATSNALNFDKVADSSKAKKDQSLARSSRIVLFVTEGEAQKILSSVFGRSTGFWRAVPSDADRPTQQPADDKKVIVILNQQ